MKKVVVALLLLVLLSGSVYACTSPTSAPAAPATSAAPTTSAAPPVTSAAPVQTYNWKLQSFVSAGNTHYDGFLPKFTELVKTRSGGRMNMTIYPAGAIVAPTEVTKAVSQDVVECALAAQGYDVSIVPESYVANVLPNSFKDGASYVDFWYNYKGGAAFNILNTAYEAKGVHMISLNAYTAPYAIMTMFPVTKVEDLKGKKIRSAGSWSQAVAATGATQVTMDLADVYNSLQTKVIDGVFMTIAGLDAYKWIEVVKYVIQPYWADVGAACFEANLAEWNKLSPDLQKIITDSARETNLNTLIPLGDQRIADLYTRSKAKGIQFLTLQGDEAVKYQAATVALWKYVETLNATSVQEMNLSKEYLDSKGIPYPR